MRAKWFYVPFLVPAHFLSVDLTTFKAKINFNGKNKYGFLNSTLLSYANFYGLI